MKRILFVVVALVSCVTPLLAQEAASPKPDPQAYELLRRAQSVRETFPADFAGFKAELICNDNGQEAKGVLDYRPETGAKIIINGLSEEATGWVKQQLNSLLSHRRASDFAKGEGRHPLSLPPDDHSPLGRRLMVNDKLKSSYRVRDGQTTEVDRTMGDRIVVTILSTLPTGKGKFLPQHFVVTGFDVKTNQLLRTEMFTDEFAQTGNVWLPTSRRVVFAENGKLTARVITLRNPQLHQPQETATAR
ncbi:MAG: DUF3386 family protein [Acidobacteriota bacterium]|nr:DUF3386 family protein [Acidobacteriota bacterium]